MMESYANQYDTSTIIELVKQARGPDDMFLCRFVISGSFAVIPGEACYLGWQESLELLAKLVEAEIKE